jgi:pimeloyl-ACP methyl ester carboxylesterase
MGGEEEFRNWDVREVGPADAAHTVLLLPGGLCTAEFYGDLLAEPRLAEAPLRFVAVTLPGFGGTPYPHDLSMENYARITGRLAAERGCDVVVGHSIGANVAIEMAAAGHFTGPIVLLSPTFSRPDEMRALGVADRVGRIPVVGPLVWAGLLRLMPYGMKSHLPADRRDVLLADVRKNDARVCRPMIRHYFAYLDRHGTLVPRLRASGVPAWVVRGDRDEVGLTDEERRRLEASPNVTLVTVPDATHMVLTDQPALLAELLTEVTGVASA